MDDGALIFVRQHGHPAGPRLVLSHGNGLAIDGYLPFWGLLCERYEVILFDFRNHGRNPCNPAWAHDWPTLVKRYGAGLAGYRGGLRHKADGGRVPFDVRSLLDTSHSGVWPPMGPAGAVRSAVYAREGHPLKAANQGAKFDLADADQAPQGEPQEPRGIRPPIAFPSDFPALGAGGLELMARATLRHDEASGKWVLACPRELEAHIFETTADPTIWPRMAKLQVPVKLICADPESEDAGPPALIGRAMAAELPIEYEAIPKTTHFLQIERPRECIRAMETFLATHGFPVPEGQFDVAIAQAR